MTREELINLICPTDASYICNYEDAFCSCDKCKEILDAYLDEYEEQIRADFVKEIDIIIQFINDNSFDHKLEYDSFKAIGSSAMICLLEQLKEHNNGRDNN